MTTILRSAALLLVLPAMAGAPAMASAQQPADAGTFTLVQANATIATETFERTADLLETTLEITNQATLVTRSTLNQDATIARMEVEVYGPGGIGDEAIESSAANFQDDAVTVEQPIGTALEGEPQPTGAGAIPYVNPSPSYMEQIIRRAHAVGGDDVEVSLWIPGQPQGTAATVSFGDGSATIDLAGVIIEAETDADGRILSATIPAQNVTITRE